MQFKIYVIPIVLASILLIDSIFVLGYKKPLPIEFAPTSRDKTQAYILPISEPNYIPILNSNIFFGISLKN